MVEYTPQKGGVFLMKIVELPQLSVVHGNTPQEFEDNFNYKMRELAGKKPSFEFRGELTAYITYTQREEIVETVEDEFAAQGIKYVCGQCPHMERPNDKRCKWGECKYSRIGRVHQNSSACELFYKEVMLGKTKPEGENDSV